MPAPTQKIKAKRNNYTLSKEAQVLIDDVPATKKSKIVSQAIINYLSDASKN